MAVYKNKKDSAYWIDYYFQGKRHRRKVGSSKRQADIVFGKVKSQIVENKYLDVKKNKQIKLSELLNCFIEEYSIVNNKPSSCNRNRQIANNLVAFFGDRYAYQIESIDVESYKKERRGQGVSFSTIDRELALLKTVFNKAKEWGVIQTPLPKIKLFRIKNVRCKYLTEDEYHRLIEVSREPLRTIIIIAVNTGMRRGELLSLKWKDVDVKERLITLWDTKNKEKRYVHMNSVVADIFIKIPLNRESEYVFAGKEGNSHISESYVSHLFIRTAKKSGLKDFRYHDLRHTFGSWLAMDGISLKTIQDLMGHKSIEMTLRYAHLSPEHKKLAVERLEKRNKNLVKRNTELSGSAAESSHLLDTKGKFKKDSISVSVN